jgi:hypothetical protein
MCGAIPPLPNTPLWHGAEVKKKAQDNFTFTLTFTHVSLMSVIYYNSFVIGS